MINAMFTRGSASRWLHKVAMGLLGGALFAGAGFATVSASGAQQASANPRVDTRIVPLSAVLSSTGGLLGLDAAIAQLLDNGGYPDSTQTYIASANCGPAGTSLAVGHYVECGVNGNVGIATTIVRIVADNAKRFVVYTIGSALGPLSGAVATADKACNVGGKNLCAPSASLPNYSTKFAFGGNPPPVNTPAVMPCAGSPTERPRQIVLACADFGWQVEGLVWQSWTSSAARGTGTEVYKTCKPSCVAGKLVKVAVHITLSAPTPTHYGLLFGHIVFTPDSKSVKTSVPTSTTLELAPPFS